MAPVMKSKALVAQKAGAFARGTRKAATKAAAASKKDAKEVAKEEEEEEVEEEEHQEQTMKRPAAAKSQEDGAECDEDDQGEEEEDSPTCDDVDPANAQIVVVEKKEPTEAELNRERTKELKKISAGDLKTMVTNFGLETGTKEAMIARVLKHEAKLRKDAAAQRAKIREVVSQRKDELDAMSIPALTKMCAEAGFKKLRSKPEKVQKLLLHWQECGGVEKALAALAVEERMQQLDDMENDQLQKLSGKYGLEVYVKEIMAERISRKENEMGCYLRPAIKEIAETVPDNSKLDMIEALLASEAQRKKEQDVRAKREEEMQSKSKSYRAMSLDELKKLVAKKKLVSGEKKDEMVTALMLASIQEDAAAARKADLQAKSTQTLSDLLSLNGLDATGSKDKMVKRFLDHEAKVSDDLKAFESGVAAAAMEQKAALEKKGNSELKDMCGEQGLALGGAKEERIERLVDEAKKSRAFDDLVSNNMRMKRRDALNVMSKEQLLEICEELEVDPLMKEIMVERIMAHEKEHPDEPKAKRARVAK